MTWFSLHDAAAPHESSSWWHSWISHGAIACVAIALAGVALGPHRVGDYFTETDFYGGYAIGARLIQHGHFDATRYGVIGPVYEVILALVGVLVPNLFVAAELISLTASVCTLLLWKALLEKLTSRRLAVLMLLLMGSNATFITFGYSASTDALAVALVSTAFWLLLTRRRLPGFVAAGVVSAIAFLTRYSAIALVPTALLILSLGGGTARRRGTAILAFSLGFAALIVPWASWCAAHGFGMGSQLHHNIAFEVFARPRGIVWDDYQKLLQPQFHSLWDVLRRDPVAVVTRLFFNLGDHFHLDARDLLSWPVALCALFGLITVVSERTMLRMAPLTILFSFAFLVLVPVFHAPRYSLVLLPIYASFAAAFFASPSLAFVVGTTPRIPLKRLLFVLLLAFTGLATWRAQMRSLAALPVELLDAAKTLRSTARPGDRLMARKPHLAWLSGLEPQAFPFADSLPQLADAVRRAHVRWIYVSWPEVETRPRFWYLLDTTATVPGLTPRWTTQRHPSVLYEVGPAFGEQAPWMANDTLLTWHGARAMLFVDPDNPDPLFALGTLEFEHDMFDSALVHLRRSLRRGPNRAATWLLLGMIGLQRGDAVEAEHDCQKALQIDPTSVDAAATLGWARLALGRPEEAATSWTPIVTRVEDLATLDRMTALFDSLGYASAARDARRRLMQLSRP